MFYVYNCKKLETADEITTEIELYIIRLLELNNISFVKGAYRFNSLYRKFTDDLLQPPAPPNPIKLPIDAAKLSIQLKDQYFHNNNPAPAHNVITELQEIYSYRSNSYRDTIVETKVILVKITYSVEQLDITLIEI